jgi:prolyl oligopeptidase
MSGIETASVKVRCHDGPMVPLVIACRRGLKRNGARPTILFGYGAYGVNYTEPGFACYWLPWLERGPDRPDLYGDGFRGMKDTW